MVIKTEPITRAARQRTEIAQPVMNGGTRFHVERRGVISHGWHGNCEHLFKCNYGFALCTLGGISVIMEVRVSEENKRLLSDIGR